MNTDGIGEAAAAAERMGLSRQAKGAYTTLLLHRDELTYMRAAEVHELIGFGEEAALKVLRELTAAGLHRTRRTPAPGGGWRWEREVTTRAGRFTLVRHPLKTTGINRYFVPKTSNPPTPHGQRPPARPQPGGRRDADRPPTPPATRLRPPLRERHRPRAGTPPTDPRARALADDLGAPGVAADLDAWFTKGGTTQSARDGLNRFGPLDSARVREDVIRWRIQRMGDPPPPPRRPAAADPPWCGRCRHEDRVFVNRWGQAKPCVECAPHGSARLPADTWPADQDRRSGHPSVAA